MRRHRPGARSLVAPVDSAFWAQLLLLVEELRGLSDDRQSGFQLAEPASGRAADQSTHSALRQTGLAASRRLLANQANQHQMQTEAVELT